MKLRVGVVGCGIGKEHIAAYRKLPEKFQVSVLCDVDAERARTLAAAEGIPTVVTDFSALCARDDLDVIDVCTPSHLHAPQVREALSRGKHVICEKPVAGSLRDADALIDAEARAARRVMPIFQNRFGSGVQKLRFLIDRGVPGRAYLATAETAWRRKADYYAVPWRGKWATELGGPLVTLGIHMLDLVHYIAGPVRSVFAHAATRVNPIETEDCLTASLCMADGSLCAFALTTGSAEERSRLHFCFEGLSAESNGAAYSYPSEPWSFCPDSEVFGRRMNEALGDFAVQPEGFPGQFSAFHSALETGSLPPVTLQDARSVLETITAIYASAGTGQAVTLPIGRNHPGYADWRPRG
ncbi:MAG: Gfo/Idh/MocA family oxidoreductase [Spirochaetia bacterium]|jgi:predicted dehydrogenase